MNKHGIAMWVRPQEGHDKIVSDLHINVWKLSSGVKDHCIDIGVMLKKCRCKATVFLYFPVAKFDLKDLKDLGSMLFDSAVCAAVFNEHLTVVKDNNKDYGDVKINGQFPEKNFRIHCLDCEHKTNIAVVFDHGGSVVKIEIPGISSDEAGATAIEDAYIRFRITGESVENLISQDELANSSIQNYTSSVEVFDLRINEIRTLKNSLVEEMHKNGGPLRFSIIQFFFMCRCTDTLVLSTRTQASARYLEEETWEKYLPHFIGGDKELKNSIIAYQWKRSEPDKEYPDFSMLVSTRCENITKKKVIKFALIVIFLGCLGSLLASGLEYGAAKIFKQTNQTTASSADTKSQVGVSHSPPAPRPGG